MNHQHDDEPMSDKDRIPAPPETFESDEEAREYGRQLAMDSLLARVLDTPSASRKPATGGELGAGEKIVPFKVWPWLAAAAAVVMVFSLRGLFPGGDTPPAGAPPLLAGWTVQPVGAARYQILEAGLVRLERGELLVRSLSSVPEPGELVIQTPNAEAVALGTEFYIGTHNTEPITPNPKPEKNPNPNTAAMNKQLTRVFVLAGTVSLATSQGNTSGDANHLLVAEGEGKPEASVVQANSEFAVDLYRQLSKENPDANLFFSPFSVSSALAMVAEGARGETAREIGEVLRFPDEARRVGDDAQLIPWQTSKIHAGMAKLNALLNRAENDEAAAKRQRLAQLREEHAELQATINKAIESGKRGSAGDAARRQRVVTDELNKLAKEVDPFELRVANALWGEKGFPFLKSFTDTVADSYGTGAVLPMDFSGDPDGSRQQINKWIGEKTNGRIVDPLGPGTINPLTRMVLTNTIYFQGKWAKPFERGNTKERDFFGGAAEPVKTETMHQGSMKGVRYGAFEADGSFFESPRSYLEGEKPRLYPNVGGFAMLELPYRGDELSMVVLAPVDKDGLPALEKSLSAAKLSGWIGQLKGRETHVYLPKFKAETDYQLPSTLKALGMERAFNNPLIETPAGDPKDPGLMLVGPNPQGADFSGMVDGSDIMKRLYLTGVIHQAFVSVDEEGTEAAAATILYPEPGDSIPGREVRIWFTPTFKADRPFLFLIRERASDSILFMGRINDPNA